LYKENYIKEIADNLINTQGTTDPKILIDSKKTVYFRFAPMSSAINGMYSYISEDEQIIVVNDSLDGLARQYACFHELGHAELEHKGRFLLNSVGVNDTKEEYEADLFSTYMVIIRNGITKENTDEFILPKRVSELIHKFL
jgi:Zn-dependent peptidase ImmA (M78 family)